MWQKCVTKRDKKNIIYVLDVGIQNVAYHENMSQKVIYYMCVGYWYPKIEIYVMKCVTKMWYIKYYISAWKSDCQPYCFHLCKKKIVQLQF